MAGATNTGPVRTEPFEESENRRGPVGLHSSSLNNYRLLNNTPGTVGRNDVSDWLGTGALGHSLSISNQSVSRSVIHSISPVEFAEAYHNVRVSFLDPQSGYARSASADVHIYNNNGISRHRANMHEKELLVSYIRRELRRAGGLGLINTDAQHKLQIAKAFYGKGAPEDFAVALAYALRIGRTAPGGLQNYCDRRAKLGVDCSGFVNAYFLKTGRISAERPISRYERGILRASQDDIQALDVLIWQNSSHIAVIDHVIANSNPRKMVVVESAESKDGLSISEYTVLQVRDNIFQVDRGEGGGRPGPVKIVEVR